MQVSHPSDAEFERKKRVAACELAIAKMMFGHDEREIAIWMAAFIGQMGRLSERQLRDEDEN